MNLVFYFALCYLIGAFPSAVVLGRLFRGVDVRKHGSGNAGGTNAWRVLGWKIGLPVMLLDVAKGVLCAVGVSRLPLGAVPVDTQTLAVLCGVVAVIGHVFPVYIGFRGGKGVGTAAGMLAATAPIPVAFALGIFTICLFTSGCVSCGSLLAAWTVPISILLLNRLTSSIRHPIALLVITLALAAFITITHRKNIVRILHGKEKTFPKLQLWRRWTGH